MWRHQREVAVLGTATWILTVGVLVAVGEMSRPIAGFALAILAIGGLLGAIGYLIMDDSEPDFASWRLEAAALCILFAVEQSFLLGLADVGSFGTIVSVLAYPAFAGIFLLAALDAWYVQRHKRRALGNALFASGVLLFGLSAHSRLFTIVAMVPLVAAVVVLFRSNDREGEAESPAGQ